MRVYLDCSGSANMANTQKDYASYFFTQLPVCVYVCYLYVEEGEAKNVLNEKEIKENGYGKERGRTKDWFKIKMRTDLF